ncbi:MAG TPA: hypothetical protein VM936_16175 [Pyrinomonadaceae bacterium]|jgi:hypothetical protein|nr:hypothetical protein [Pyrinomonadaceae bacterium]
MRRRIFLLAVWLSAFFAGASLDQELRTRRKLDCFCMSLKCRVVSAADHPLTALRHPLEVLEMLFTARGYD